MANDGDLQLLCRNLAQWNESRAREIMEAPHEPRKPDLSRADLRRSKLIGADLRYCDLAHARLSNADLSNAQLGAADLHGASLRTAKLIGANLSGANLRHANLSGANVGGANFNGCQSAPWRFTPTVPRSAAERKSAPLRSGLRTRCSARHRFHAAGPLPRMTSCSGSAMSSFLFALAEARSSNPSRSSHLRRRN